ncbi:hypothetical protein [Nocardia brasiliensis]|uniref:hypothetical protein n=1 Tax=Nocardia brasiliensis TaxID=37326 RepID=UPI0024544309|nr:hypothetical protein [Nocardia brasiliensis]
MAISLLAAQFPELAPVWSALQADHGLVAHIVGRLDGLLDTAAAGAGLGLLRHSRRVRVRYIRRNSTATARPHSAERRTAHERDVFVMGWAEFTRGPTAG